MIHASEFYSQVTVFDTETTNLYPDQAEIVELAAARYDKGWHVESRLFDARNGIPPAASAKNNIGPRLIRGKPFFDQSARAAKEMLAWDDARWFVAHNVGYDRQVLEHAWLRMESGNDAKACRDDSRWICTWRLGKQILAHDFADIEYGLNYLRYLLDLPVPEGHAVHRAGADTLSCALLLEELVRRGIGSGLLRDAPDLGEQVHALCWSHITIKTWPFGKYKGTPLEDIPDDYYAWALKNIPALNESDAAHDRDLTESIRTVLERRLLDA